MSDIMLELDGDASGAQAALDDTAQATKKLDGATKDLRMQWSHAEQEGKKQEAQLNKIKMGFLAAGAAAVKFGADSVHAYAEAERISRQLERVAGDLTGAFEQQADALEAQLHIDGELIKQQQTLLLQWGAQPGAIEPAVRAIQDYAAASGKDGVQATKDFLQAVENGDAKLAKFGVNFEQTGDKVKDFTALTAAMTGALGGAAEANAHSLQGGLDAVSIAMGNVQEAFGGVIASMEAKMGVLEKAASFMQNWARGIGGSSGILDTLIALSPIGHGAALAGLAGGGPQAPDLSGVGVTMSPAAIHLPGFDPNKPATKTGKGASTKPGRTDEERLEDAKKYYAGIEQLAATALQQEEDNYADELDLSAKRVDLALEEADDRTKIRRDMLLAIEKDNAEHAEKESKEAAKALEKSTKDANDRAAKKAHEAQQAGDQIGAAFVNALTDQLAKLAEGGEFDAAIFVSEILAAAVGVAGTVIGTAFGQPAVGAAIGNLAAMGIRAGGSAISKGNKSNGPRTMHEGGEVAHWPRFHSGGGLGSDEVPIIGQVGEHMLSRRDVSNMGGHAGVEAAKRGGGGVTLNVQAIDAKSLADTFSGTGGDGLKQALRRGHGALPELFGKGPR